MIRHVCSPTYGSDPEGFFATLDGKIVGAEKVLPTGGVGDYYSKAVLDGVQYELHPCGSGTIMELGKRLGMGFSAIVKHLREKKLDGQFRLDYSQVVTMDQSELSSLSEAARTLGCQPSENFYRKHPIKVPKDFPVRSAAGHIHLGLSTPIWGNYPVVVDHRRLLVPLFDIFVGNTCVLLDRDPLAATRRQLYGHAGEFRFQPHGIEYRTTSNFWLKSYALMELVFGLANTAVQVLATSLANEAAKTSYDPEQILAEKVDIRKIERAIERNNAKLAWENWTNLVGFFKEHVPNTPTFPINTFNVDTVSEFLKVAAADALQPFLPVDPTAHWIDLSTDSYYKFKDVVGWPQLLVKVTEPPKPTAP